MKRIKTYPFQSSESIKAMLYGVNSSTDDAVALDLASRTTATLSMYIGYITASAGYVLELPPQTTLVEINGITDDVWVAFGGAGLTAPVSPAADDILEDAPEIVFAKTPTEYDVRPTQTRLAFRSAGAVSLRIWTMEE